MASVLAQMGGEASPFRKSAIVCLPLAYPESERRQGKQGIPANDLPNYLNFAGIFGAGEGIRTLDPNLGSNEDNAQAMPPT